MFISVAESGWESMVMWEHTAGTSLYGKLPANQEGRKRMQPSKIHIDPADALSHPADWKQISWEEAMLRVEMLPVVVTWSMRGQAHADLLTLQWVRERVSGPLSFAWTMKFFVQVGNPKATAAKSPVGKTMSLSKAGADFIGKGYENPAEKGFDKKTSRYSSYDDGYGYPTIGYGHLIKPKEDFSKGLSPKETQQLFIKDSARYVEGVNRNLKVQVTQQQFDALVSLAFNVGAHLKTSPIRALNAGAAVKESDFLHHNTVHHKPSKGLTNRRKAEWQMFSKGVYNANH